MKRAPFLFLFLIGLAACHSPAKKVEPEAPPIPLLALAPEAAPARVKVLKKDPRQGCTWVESEGLITTSDRESPSQARAAAVAEARMSAMQDFLGVEVRSQFLDFQQESLRDQKSLTESLLRTTRQGRILNEEIASDEYRDIGDCRRCRYYVGLRTCILPLPESADKSFHVELKISHESFVEGSEAKISVTTNQDCFVYIYDVGMDGETSLIVPNDLMPQVQIRAGQTWEYPDEAAQKRGIRLIAQLPESRPRVSAETIRLIATKVPLSAQVTNPQGGDYLSVLRRVNNTKTDWDESTEAFTIIRR